MSKSERERESETQRDSEKDRKRESLSLFYALYNGRPVKATVYSSCKRQIR